MAWSIEISSSSRDSANWCEIRLRYGSYYWWHFRSLRKHPWHLLVNFIKISLSLALPLCALGDLALASVSPSTDGLDALERCEWVLQLIWANFTLGCRGRLQWPLMAPWGIILLGRMEVNSTFLLILRDSSLIWGQFLHRYKVKCDQISLSFSACFTNWY